MKKKILLTLGVLLYLYNFYGEIIGSPSQWKYRCYSVDVPQGIDVPEMPHCGLNNKTVQGIDTDNDGVRDDIQRYIASIEVEHAFFKRGLLQYAKKTQRALVESGDTSKAQRNFMGISLALDCAGSATVDKMYQYTEVIFNMSRNTIRRRISHRIWHRKLEVQIVPSVPPTDACDFNINEYEGERWQ